jgi:hypothetical protein
MVWHFVSNSHKVMPALIVILSSKTFCESSLQFHRYIVVNTLLLQTCHHFIMTELSRCNWDSQSLARSLLFSVMDFDLHFWQCCQHWEPLRLVAVLYRVLRLQPGHKFCLLGRLSTEVGWHHYDTIKELEENRKAKSKVFYEHKKQLIQLRLKAAKRVEEQISPLQETLIPITYKV